MISYWRLNRKSCIHNLKRLICLPALQTHICVCAFIPQTDNIKEDPEATTNMGGQHLSNELIMSFFPGRQESWLLWSPQAGSCWCGGCQSKTEEKSGHQQDLTYQDLTNQILQIRTSARSCICNQLLLLMLVRRLLPPQGRRQMVLVLLLLHFSSRTKNYLEENPDFRKCNVFWLYTIYNQILTST